MELMKGLKDWETKTRVRQDKDGRERNYRIPRLRTFFAVGLGRSVSVSQAEFSFWCGMSRDMIAAVESGKTKITAGLAGRIYDLTGAELSWLNGRADEETYGYPSLHAWFPRTMPLTKNGIERVHGYRDSLYYAMIHHILGSLSRRWYRNTGEVLLPAPVIKKAFDHFTFPENWGPYPPLWEAFAFAPGPNAIRRAIEEKMLDDAPADSPLRKVLDSMPQTDAVTGDSRFMSEVCHNLIRTLSLVERGLVSASGSA
jgi:hypothetical protein